MTGHIDLYLSTEGLMGRERQRDSQIKGTSMGIWLLADMINIKATVRNLRLHISREISAYLNLGKLSHTNLQVDKQQNAREPVTPSRSTVFSRTWFDDENWKKNN